jgi:peptidoglycan/LPS O-acetylase OafA/YrhL
LTYRADIDGLRGAAVLFVVAYHAFPELLPGGFTGVDIFFVISGYLITGLIREEQAQGRFSFAQFYARRVRRLFPALFVVLAATLFAGWLLLFPPEFEALGRHAGAAVVFIINFVLNSEVGYFDTESASKPLLHLWSLSIEEQFYLAYPLLLIAMARLKIPLIGAAALAAASFALCLFIMRVAPDAAFYLPHARAFEFLAGALVSFVERAPRFPARVRSALALLGGAVILFALTIRREDGGFPAPAAIIPVAGAALVIFAGPGAWFNRVILAAKPLVAVGLISYPLYLWHWPLLSLASIEIGETITWALRLTLVAVSVALAAATYWWIERPIRTGAPTLKRSFAISAPLAAAGIVGLAASAALLKPVRDVPPDAVAYDMESSSTPECQRDVGRKLFYCLSDQGARSVALIGDSHARAIYEILKTSANEKGRGLIFLGHPGCPPFLDVVRDNQQRRCPIDMKWIVDFLNAHPEIIDVYIEARYAAAFSGINLGARPDPKFYRLELVGSSHVTDREDIFVEGLKRMLVALKAGGKRVTILLDYPELDFEPRTCFGWRRGAACGMAAEDVAARQAPYTRAVRRLAAEIGDISIFDLKSLLCTASRCAAELGGQPLYRSTSHISEIGAMTLVGAGKRIPVPADRAPASSGPR